ncbi:Glyoxalase/Bleomycin resistance protein/Dihydroxybiphenyl dioxygenase [Naviculisporaceae sp. PSN 640]
MTTVKPHSNPLGHLSIGVRDYAVSKAFYTAVLETIGLKLVYDSEARSDSSPPSSSTTATVSENKKNKIRTLGYGPDPEHEILNIFEFKDDATPPGPGFHLAFNAPTRDAVVEFHATALGFGGMNNGLPGLRRHYGANYFAGFVVDPDGWRLEVVCKEEENGEGKQDQASLEPLLIKMDVLKESDPATSSRAWRSGWFVRLRVVSLSMETGNCLPRVGKHSGGKFHVARSTVC